MPNLRETTETGAPEDRTDALYEALRERFSMDEDDARAIAEVVAEQFRGEAEVNDETLDPEVRSIFYTLEAKKLLAFRREEYSIESGERRRAFFWRVRDEELARIAELKSQAVEEDVYAALPKSVWSRHAS
ncbi:MAG: DUF6015 family protein [Thermoplasmatota archaeon]